jgi:hypothetical protein
MEDYEIRDVSRREEVPNLSVNFDFSGMASTQLVQEGGSFRGVPLGASITNASATPAHHAVFQVFIDTRISILNAGDAVQYPGVIDLHVDNNIVPTNRLGVNWTLPKMPIFEGIAFGLFQQPPTVSFPIAPEEFVLACEIHSPKMPKKLSLFRIVRQGVTATIRRLE